MANRWHVEWLKEGVTKWNKRRKRVSFKPELQDVNFRELLPPDFRDSPKTSRYFEKIDLSNADLRGADLSNLNFAQAKFTDATLRLANLQKTNFSGANFLRTDLEGVSFFGTILFKTTFEDCLLDKATFEGAEIRDLVMIKSRPEPSEEKLIQPFSRIFTRNQEEHSLYMAARQNSHIATQSLTHSGRRSNKTDLFEDKRTPKVRYDVYFGTNRNPNFQRGALVDFGTERIDGIHYGLCEVIIPQNRKTGTLGSPLWKRLLNIENESIRIGDLINLDKTLFAKHIADGSQKMKVKARPTMFVHGFNNSFEDGVIRAAQLGYDLKIGQGMGLFSWASKNSFYKYHTDETICEVSKYALADFIEVFSGTTQASTIDIIAHSMGCRCLLQALEVLANGRKSVLRKINQVILAAADVDAGIMPRLAENATRYCTRTTSYISDRDQALMLSGWRHSFPRVGICPPTFILEGIDTILVNKLDLGAFAHGYLGKNRTILSDIFDLLSSNRAPSLRQALDTIEETNGVYWKVRE